ncbi:hypothetical protein [Paenibacillus zeisoli]|nr:hypothetical protein [Paenibacillus zeisoli]
MKTSLRFLSIIITLAFCYVVVHIYYTLNGGTPWGKANFKQEVEEYLSLKYPELSYSVESEYYGFKEGQYSAHVTTLETEFEVSEREGYGLWDNYPHSLWTKEATAICNDSLAEYTNDAKCRVELVGSGGLNEVKEPFPSYEQVRDQLRMQVNIHFSRSLRKNDNQDLKMILGIKESIEQTEISNVIDFTFSDVSFFNVNHEISTITDLENKAYYPEPIQ